MVQTKSCHFPRDGIGTRSESAATLQPSGQILALDQVHDKVGLPFVRARVQAGDDVRMSEDRRGECLAPETIGEIGIGRRLGAEQLDGDGTLQPEVHRLVDRRHPAPADDPAQLVAVADDPRLARIGHGGTLAETA